MNHDLTNGPIIRTMLRFALPMILGDLLQQCYNIADTLIVGRVLGADALAAVGSAFSLMTFLTSILLGLAMGSGTVFSIRFGQKKTDALKECVLASFVLLGSVTLILNVLVYLGIDWIIQILQIPQSLVKMMHDYLIVIFAGLAAIFLYNFFAALLRSLGNSIIPLVFLAVSAMLNIVLDLWFVAGLHRGVAGAAEATVLSQYVSGIGIALYTALRFPQLFHRGDGGIRLRLSRIREITGVSALTCLQQSIMNLGILAVQGLVNSFGPAIMAAFAAGVKIDAFAYLPVQDFGNAFSIFIAQNYGLRRAHLRRCHRVRPAADDDVHRRHADRDHHRGRTLSAHRRRILSADRPVVFVLRHIPRPWPPRHVPAAHHRLLRQPRLPRLCPFFSSRHRRHRHLVVRSHRMAAG